MKKSKFSEAQIAFILKQAKDWTGVGEVCRKAGISEATFYNWRKKYSGLMPSEMKRLRQLEEKKRQAEEERRRIEPRQGDAAGRDSAKALRPGRRRLIIDQMRATWQVSIRRACAVLNAERSSYHYKARRDDQAELRHRIKEIAQTRVRLGYRRIKVLLRRDGWTVNAKRVQRLYREMWMQLRHKTPKRQVKAKLRDDRKPAVERNDVWATDFLHDQIYDGRKIRVLAIIDTFTCCSPAPDVRQAYRGADVVETLVRACNEIGYPKMIRCDNGPELVSRDVNLWAYQRDVTLDFSRPGKPTDNAFVESFNGKFRAECLNAHWLLGLDDARRNCEAWRRGYNEHRPHSAIGDKCPIELMIGSGANGPP